MRTSKIIFCESKNGTIFIETVVDEEAQIRECKAKGGRPIIYDDRRICYEDCMSQCWFSLNTCRKICADDCY